MATAEQKQQRRIGVLRQGKELAPSVLQRKR
jgi:hypothetical protein